jgi:leader peptidase (prepilin peptidase)/N-methyltransferase
VTHVLVLLAAVLGLVVGSFVNVVAWRVPRGESVVRPPSACVACGTPVRPRDKRPGPELAAAARPVPDLLGAHQPALPAGRARHRRPVRRPGARARRGSGAAGVPLPGGGRLALALIDLDCKRLPDA